MKMSTHIPRRTFLRGAGVAIAARCEDSIVERNDLGVVPADRIPPTDVPGEDLPDPNDPCADPERVYANLTLLVRFLDNVFQVLLAIPPVDPYKAIGGIQIAAGSWCSPRSTASERVALMRASRT